MDDNNISHDQIAASSNFKGMFKKDNAVAVLKMHVTLPIILLGCSFISTLVSLIAIPISKTFDDYYRGNNTPLSDYKYTSENNKLELKEFVKIKILYNQATGQLTKRFCSELFNLDYSDSQAFVSNIDGYLPTFFQVNFVKGYGLNKTLNHIKAGLYVYYIINAFDPVVNVLYYDTDPVELIDNKVKDLVNHYELLFKEPLEICFNNSKDFILLFLSFASGAYGTILGDVDKAKENIGQSTSNMMLSNSAIGPTLNNEASVPGENQELIDDQKELDGSESQVTHVDEL